MMSAPSAMSGRSRRTCAQNSIASSRECRRFIRFRIRSSPDCSDRCRCGISRSSSGDHVEQIAIDLDGIDRGNPQPLQLRHVPQDLLDQLPELRRARQIGAIAGDIDAGQHDLGMAALDQRADLFDHGAHRHRARIAAAIGDDAEGAAMIAAVLHLHEDARQAGLEAFEQMRRHLLDRHDVGRPRSSRCRRCRSRRAIERRARVPPRLAAHLVVIADDAIDLGHVGEHLGLGLRRAAGDDDPRSGPFALDPADRLPRLRHRFVGHRAAVDHDGIGQARRFRPRARSPRIRRR